MEKKGLFLGAFKQRPSEGTRFIIRKNSDIMIKFILDDISTWSLNPQLRYTYLVQLYNFILCCEDGIASNIQKITKVILKYVDDDIKEIQVICLRIAYSIGFFVSPDVHIPFILEAIFQKEPGNLANATGDGVLKQSLKNVLRIMNEVIKGSSREELKPHLKSLVNLLNSPEFENNESSGTIECLLNLIENIMNTAQEQCKEYKSELFSSIINICSIINESFNKVIVYVL